MHFKPILLLTLMACAGCGALGTSDEKKAETGGLSQGCLNDMKSTLSRFQTGDVPETEWKSTFDCVGTSLDFFKQYVRGSTADGYLVSDMDTFTGKFLFTNRTVRQEFMKGAFLIKSALLGGKGTLLTFKEIDRVKTLLDGLKEITTPLIPVLKKMHIEPTQDVALEASEAIEKAVLQFADLLDSMPVAALSSEALKLFLSETYLAMGRDEPEDLSDELFLAKWLASNTRPDAFQAEDWSGTIRLIAKPFGLFYAFKKVPQANILDDRNYRNFAFEIMNRARPILENALEAHGGALPFPLLDRAIRSFVGLDGLGVSETTALQALRPFIRRILESKDAIGIDQQSLSKLYTLANRVHAHLNMIDRIYDVSGMNPTSVDYARLSNAVGIVGGQIASSDTDTFNRVKHLALDFRPLFHEGNPSILYHPSATYSRYQLIQLTLIRIGVEQLTRVYTGGENRMIQSDLEAVLKDFRQVLFELEIVDPTIVEFERKRIQDMNLFMFSSDGDEYASLDEMTDFGAITISSGTLAKKMREIITPACDSGLGNDLLGWTWVTAPCFRNEFWNNMHQWLEHFPLIQAQWSTMDFGTKENVKRWIEHGARRNGYNDDNMASYDFRALSIVLHYTETLYAKLASNPAAPLTKSNIMAGYPLFKPVLKRKLRQMIPVDLNNEYILKGVYTYLVRYKEIPSDFRGFGTFGLWMITYPSASLSTDRTGIYNIVCLLGSPESPEQQKLTSQYCKAN
jgi:hypothetical protein